jgi:hypothetical protein
VVGNARNGATRLPHSSNRYMSDKTKACVDRELDTTTFQLGRRLGSYPRSNRQVAESVMDSLDAYIYNCHVINSLWRFRHRGPITRYVLGRMINNAKRAKGEMLGYG